MPTFQTLQDRVTRRIIDLPATVTTEVPGLINKAMRTLEEMHNFKVMEAETGQLTTTAAARTLSAVVATDLKQIRGLPYLVKNDGSTRDLLFAAHRAAVPANFKESRGLPYLVKNDGSTRDLLLAANRAAALDVFSLNDASEKGEPKLILDPEPSDDQNTRTLEVFPFPDGLSDWSGGEYRVVIPYWRYVAALSDGTDENWFTSNAEWYLVFLATAEGFYLDWDEPRAQMWEVRAGDLTPDGRAVGEFRKVIKQDKLARLGSVRQLAMHRDVWAAQIRS